MSAGYPIPPDSPVSLAFHEAAHAVMALLVGMPIVTATVKGTPEYQGQVLVDVGDPLNPATLQRSILIKLAAPACYKIRWGIGGRRDWGTQQDFDAAIPLAEQLGYRGSQATRYLEAAEHVAISNLKRNWESVELLRDALLIKPTLSGWEVARLVGEKLRPFQGG